MKKYELLYILDKDADDAKRERAIKRIEDTITKGNGVVSNVDIWGMKKFAYPINYKNEGFYVLVEFESDPEVIKNIEHAMHVHAVYVRKMITTVIENKKTRAAEKLQAEKAAAREQAAKERAEKEAAEKAAQEAAAKVAAEEATKAAEEAAPAVEEVKAEEVPAETEVAAE